MGLFFASRGQVFRALNAVSMIYLESILTCALNIELARSIFLTSALADYGLAGVIFGRDIGGGYSKGLDAE